LDSSASSVQYSSGTNASIQAQRHGLHAPGRKPPAAADRLPQHRADLVSDQPIEDAARLLGVHQVHVERARRGERGLHRLGRDLVEGGAHDMLALEILAQRLGHVPGDGLSLAVGVGRQEELLRRFRRLLQLAHDRLLLFGYEVLGQEVALDVDAELRFRQVAHMPDRRPHHVAGAEEAGQGARLGRRLYDYQGSLVLLRHRLSC
jgi:hypothetical protein